MGCVWQGWGCVGGVGWVWVWVGVASCLQTNLLKFLKEELLELRKVYYTTSHALMHMYAKHLGSC